MYVCSLVYDYVDFYKILIIYHLHFTYFCIKTISTKLLSRICFYQKGQQY